ncbi:UDP-glucose 4-epimerase family protein [Rhizobium cremeum]|uniref:UDP-glucose 4-epimerase family protein n=1 Tax=Rhizobium cremeum TaxID=2813827 RepID=UPI0039E0CFA3
MILVTGGSGFVGRALTRELARRGLPFRTAGRRAGSCDFVVGDIDGATDWAGALAGIDQVVHLAARVHVMHDNTSDPLAAFRTSNRDGALNLARQAAAFGVKRFVFVSTLKVNGEETAPGRAFRADDTPHPLDPYGISKREAEEGLFDIAARTGMEVVCIRPPLVYGPGVKANFAALHKLASSGFPLPFLAIRNRRSMVYVGNLVDFILRCLEHPAAANRVFLVSDGDDVSLPVLISRIRASLGRPARLFPVPPFMFTLAARLLGKQAVAQRLLGSLEADITDSRAALEWAPPFTMEDGLKAMAAEQPLTSGQK